jgi:NTE family protein
MNRFVHKHPKRIPRGQGGLGLALSAGGARGAYQLGCWRAFLDAGLTFESVSGSSIGSLNGALICQGDWKAAYDLWLELTNLTILKPELHRLGKLATAAVLDIGLLMLPVPNFKLLKFLKYASGLVKFGSKHGALGTLHRHGLIDISSFKPFLEKHLNLKTVLNQSSSLFVTASGAPDPSSPLGRAHCYRLQELCEEDAWNVLAASMAVPFVFSSIEIQGARFTDGGVSNWLPIKPLYDGGVRDIVAISIKAGYQLNPEDYPGSRILLLKPEKPLGRFPTATFRFTRQAVMDWIEQGYVDASRSIDSGPLRGRFTHKHHQP